MIHKADKNVRAVIIDDESNSRETLRRMLDLYCPEVHIIGEAGSVTDARALIRQMGPDLVFLDVEIPPGTGFDVLNGLDIFSGEVIFVTAHDHYAINAIKVSALDYLLKPISRQELVEAVNRYRYRKMETPRQVFDLLRQQLDPKKEYPERLAVPSLQGCDVVKVSDILYCEGDRNYTTIYLKEGASLLASKTLKEYEKILPPATFIRVHQKYLVNINFVKRYLKGRGGSLVMSDGKTIDVSQNKKQTVISALG